MEKFRLCAFADEADKMISGQIEALKGNSMNLIELRGIDGKNVADLTADEARELKKRLDSEGIAVWSIGSPIGKVDITSPAQDELDRFKRVLETANICGAGNIRMFSFYKTDSSTACFDEICRRLGVCRRVGDRNAKPCRLEHRNIVVIVTDGDRFLSVNAEKIGEAKEKIAL